MGKEKTSPKIFYGWVITGAVFINLAVAYGAQYSFGVLFPSLLEEFRWNRQSIAGAFSLYNFLYSILGVLLGRLSDRLGPRLVLMAGSVCLGAGIGLISRVQAVWHLYLIYGLLASWGMSAAYITGSPTVVKWFVERRGFAVGLSQAGMGAGTVAVPPVCGAMIVAFGWRQACVVLGAAVLIVLFAMAILLIGRPEEIGLHPDGKTPERKSPPGKTIPEPIDFETSYSVGEAVRTRSFWILTALFFSTWLFIFLPMVHLVIFAMDIGVGQKMALTALGALGATSMFGRLIMGTLSDRLGRKAALAVNLGFQAFSWILIMGAESGGMLLFFATVFGFSYGGVGALFPAIIGDYFGRRQAGSVIGAMFTLSGVATAIGPLFAGYIHDLLHSYQIAFLLGALSNLLALFFLAISRPPEKNIPSLPGVGAAAKLQAESLRSVSKPPPP